MKLYKKLKITRNALVPKGAVGEKAIFKCHQEKKAFYKDDRKMEMTGIMYMLDKLDSQKCKVAKEDLYVIDDCMIDFMKNGDKQLYLTHDGDEKVEAYYKELWQVKKGDPVFKDEKFENAIAFTAKFLDRELFNKVEKLEWETSIEGEAIEIELPEEINKTNNNNESEEQMEELKKAIEEMKALMKSQNESFEQKIKEQNELIEKQKELIESQKKESAETFEELKKEMAKSHQSDENSGNTETYKTYGL